MTVCCFPYLLKKNFFFAFDAFPVFFFFFFNRDNNLFFKNVVIFYNKMSSNGFLFPNNVSFFLSKKTKFNKIEFKETLTRLTNPESYPYF